MPELKSTPLLTLTASVSRLCDVGAVPAGTRHVDLLGAGTFEDDKGAYDQKDAEGFIRLNALRLRTLAMRNKGG